MSVLLDLLLNDALKVSKPDLKNRMLRPITEMRSFLLFNPQLYSLLPQSKECGSLPHRPGTFVARQHNRARRLNAYCHCVGTR